uniref:Uncharacterized protein n=1 Tax=Romanomermis culicivorax TaxID=13658 RepID=A0A915KQH8_ROMCU
MIHGTVVVAEILVQGQQCVPCTNVNGHGKGNAYSPEKLIKTILCKVRSMKNSRDELDTWWVTRRRQCNTMQRVCGSEMEVVWQSGCLDG